MATRLDGSFNWGGKMGPLFGKKGKSLGLRQICDVSCDVTLLSKPVQVGAISCYERHINLC
jgi:hypothetical protein